MRAPGSLMMVVLAGMSASAAAASDRPLNLPRLQGDYKRYFQSEIIGNGPYRALDELQILPLGKDRAYFDVGLSFVNGHECGLAGVAVVRGASMLYRKPDDHGECRLTLRVERGAITFDDADRNCQRLSCGARGGYTGASFKLSWRKPLKGVAALRTSEFLQQAVSEFNELPPESRDGGPR